MSRLESSLRKAAILVAALDRENAEMILRQLPTDQAIRVRQAAQFLRDIDPAEQEAVIAEFFQIGPVAPEPPRRTPPAASFAPPRLNDPYLPGIELDGVAAKRSGKPRSHGTPAAPGLPPSFRCLEQADLHTLLPLLEKEHPQTVAVVISQLPHARAAQLLMTLPNPLQAEVLQRLSELDELDVESLHEIERQLEAWISQQSHRREVRSAGIQTVANILQAAGPQGRDVLVANLRQRDGLLADRLASNPAPRELPTAAPRPTSTPLVFDDLIELEPRALAAVLHAAEPELVVLALAGADEPLIQRFLTCLAPHEAAALRRDLRQNGPTRLSDVEAAQRELALVAQELADAGRIRIGRSTLSMAA